jgi:hypothetical protein
MEELGVIHGASNHAIQEAVKDLTSFSTQDAPAVAEAEDHTGKVGRLGIGLKTNIRV